MSTPIIITDDKGNEAKIVDHGLLVSQSPAPALGGEDFLQIPFVEALTIEGDGVTTDLRVDGSVNSIDAFIEARAEGDLYIKTANIIVEGAGNIALEDFGNLSELTNGLDTFIQNKGVKFPITKQPIKTNLDLVRIGTLTPAVGSDETAFRIKQVQGAGATLYNPVWDFTRLASGIDGVRLSANTKQRLGITINDALGDLTSFTVIMTGFIRLI